MTRFASTIAAAVLLASLAAIPAPARAGEPLTFDSFIHMGRVASPRVSPDGKRVVFVVAWQDLATDKAHKDLYMVPTEGGEVRRLTRSEGSNSEPAWSPDGRWIAFTSSRSGDSQIWLLPVGGGEAHQLTHLSTGASAPQWTPDGKSVVFESSVFPDCPDDSCNAARIAEQDTSKVKARIIKHLLYVHWDHWRDARRSHAFIVPATGGTPRDLTPVPWEVPTITSGSSHDVAVSPDGAHLCVVANTDSNAAWSINNDLFLVPTAGGKWTRITTNPANDNNPVYSPSGRTIAYKAMKRPGFESDRFRLMLYDVKSGTSREAAPALADKFDRSVGDIAWSPSGRSLYVTCEDAGYESLYEIDANSGKIVQLTHGMTLGDFEPTPDGKRLVFLAQSATMPTEVFVADRSGKHPKNISRINAGRLAGLEMNPLEPFEFAGAGGTTVHGWLLKPPGFDASKKWPLVFLVHGGPQGAWMDEFHWRWNYQMFAAPGYVVVAINPRGSTGYGQKFTDEISKDWGGKVYDDLMKGLDYCLATYNFIDSKRMAAAGASYGGYMMDWFLGHTDRFDCIVTHDGVYNLESMYGATEELWFPEWEFGGPPWEHRELYEKWSPHLFAAKFHTPTLVVHGGRDFRVPLAQGMQLFTALQRQGVPSEFLYFPDEGHFVLKPQNAQLWWKTVRGWIGRWTAE